jgi:hypothetical protein
MKRTALAAILLISAIGLAGCSSQGTATRHVASLSTKSPSPSASTSTAQDDGRPRERLDMSDDEFMALQNAYQKCLSDHGMVVKGAPGSDGKLQASDDVVAAAQKACLSKQPLPPWEEDRNNPDAPDFALKVVDCLRAKGIKYVDVDNDPDHPMIGISLGGPQNDSDSITKGMTLTPVCQKEVQAGMKK